jgi:hypothetical protein
LQLGYESNKTADSLVKDSLFIGKSMHMNCVACEDADCSVTYGIVSSGFTRAAQSIDLVSKLMLPLDEATGNGSWSGRYVY